MMSDFSVGFFTTNENKDKVYPYLIKNDLFIQFNEAWVGKLSIMDWDLQPQPQNLALSKEVPLLYVMHAEDHGFSLKILHEEAVKFSFDISYEVGEELYTEIGIGLYGNDWWQDESKRDERHKQIKEEWVKQLEQQGILDEFFSNINLDSLKVFHLFGISTEKIVEMNNILSVKNFADDSHGMVYALLDCLGLTFFSFVSYDYMSRGDDDRFTILNS